MHQVTYTEMTERELNQLVKDHLGFEFDFVADQECGNDSYHVFDLTVATTDPAELEDHDRTYHSLFAKGSGKLNPFMTWPILFELVRRNILPAGKYLIKVSW